MTSQTAAHKGAEPGTGFVLAPEAAEVRWMGNMATRFLATGDSTKGEFCLVDETAPPGSEVPLHRHSEDVESFFVLDGTIAFYLGTTPTRAGAGSFVHIPRGAVHGFRVESSSARYLILTTPRHGEFYRAITIPADANGQPATFDVEDGKIGQAIGELGIEFIAPLPPA